MRIHFHRWHYPANGETLRICRKCARWQTFTGDTATGGYWTWRNE